MSKIPPWLFDEAAALCAIKASNANVLLFFDIHASEYAKDLAYTAYFASSNPDNTWADAECMLRSEQEKFCYSSDDPDRETEYVWHMR